MLDFSTAALKSASRKLWYRVNRTIVLWPLIGMIVKGSISARRMFVIAVCLRRVRLCSVAGMVVTVFRVKLEARQR